MRRVAVAVSAVLVLGSVTGCSILGGQAGTPSKSAVSVSKTKVKTESLSSVKSTVSDMKQAIDLDTGYGGISKLSSDDASAWKAASSDTALQLDPDKIKTELASSNAPKKVVKAIDQDCSMLDQLRAIAMVHHNSTGAQALKYFHRVTEDVNYYLTGKGEEYGVSHIEGGYAAVETFISKLK